MRGIHYLNAGLWLANAITWLFYAKAIPMALLSVAAAIAAVVIARTTDNWRY